MILHKAEKKKQDKTKIKPKIIVFLNFFSEHIAGKITIQLWISWCSLVLAIENCFYSIVELYFFPSINPYYVCTVKVNRVKVTDIKLNEVYITHHAIWGKR